MMWNRLFQLLVLFTAPLVNSFPGGSTSSSEESDEENDCARIFRNCMRRLPTTQAVCGTDGNTYDTICRLYYTNCWIYDVNIQLGKAYDGPCMTTPVTRAAGFPGVKPPDTTDPYYEPDQPRCNFICPDSRDNVLVCGSDGVTYLSECYLNWLNCRKNTTVTLAYPGPCLDFGTLSPPTVEPALRPPVVDGGGGGVVPGASAGGSLPRAAPTIPPTTVAPTPACSQYCPLVSDPVCGTDGNTYISPCLLEVQACVSNDPGLIVATEGVCEATAAKTSTNGTGPQACPRVETCPLLYLPVCGSDGLTYQSECHLLAKACTSDNIIHRNLRVVSVGECPDLSIPKNCGECSPIWQPVCGFDNVTYYSECHLRQYSCENNLYLKTAYRSICKAGLIECPDYCPVGVNNPVCGTDGNTYPSLCFLSFAACVNNDRKLTQKHRGECSLDPCERRCPLTVYQPVCSSTGETYQNDCFLWVAMCRDSALTRAGPNDVRCNLAIP